MIMNVQRIEQHSPDVDVNLPHDYVANLHPAIAVRHDTLF